MADVVLYSTRFCAYCRAAKAFFHEQGIPFREIDLTGDDEARDALTARTGRRSVPQIFVGDHHVGGYDDLRALDRAGGLRPLVAA